MNSSQYNNFSIYENNILECMVTQKLKIDYKELLFVVLTSVTFKDCISSGLVWWYVICTVYVTTIYDNKQSYTTAE